MKKTMLFAASAAVLALTACGAGTASDQPSEAKPVSATTEAPAQNVRTPETNARMAQDSSEGLAAFTYYYFDAKNYALQTGDASLMRGAAADCSACLADADAIEAVYEAGGWIVGGQPKPLNVIAAGKPDKQGRLSAVVPFMQDASTTVGQDGKIIDSKDWDPDGTTLTVTANYTDGAWQMLSVKETPDAQLPG
ncbi:hypothetical protein HGG74_01280 [Arthrobacter sp. E918]|uniref:DUF6318 domain-containing protein n=2 Tax=Arthrobacter mobilis TaxID=2724944 RepID=A0A7X6H9Y0_9MICC|nr:hypothetical protein [Arthrobacter mobilis]